MLQILVDDAIDLGSAHAVGEERRHDGARAAAHVDVEVAGALEPLLDRGDHTDFVHTADHAAASQGERVARPPRPPAPDYPLEEVHARLIVAT